jgi:excisionase family DNA binding protein
MLTVAAAADQLQLSTKTVRRMIARGELISHRFGRSLRISEEDLRRFVAPCRG